MPMPKVIHLNLATCCHCLSVLGPRYCWFWHSVHLAHDFCLLTRFCLDKHFTNLHFRRVLHNNFYLLGGLFTKAIGSTTLVYTSMVLGDITEDHHITFYLTRPIRHIPPNPGPFYCWLWAS